MNIETDKSFKYDYEKLDPASEEFNFLKKTFKTTSYNISYNNIKEFEIYKVFQTNLTKTTDENSNNLMLLHGTSKKGTTGILKEGFRNSEKGWFGKGVYMTDCINIALRYSFMAGNNLSKRYLFVNEVLESETIQTFEFDPKDMKDLNVQRKHQFEKHFTKSSPQPTEKDYIMDFKGRRYVIPNEDNMDDEYIAEASVVIPRYLIVLIVT